MHRAQSRKKWFVDDDDAMKNKIPLCGKLFHPLHDVDSILPFGMDVSFKLRKNTDAFLIQKDVTEESTDFEVGELTKLLICFY